MGIRRQICFCQQSDSSFFYDFRDEETKNVLHYVTKEEANSKSSDNFILQSLIRRQNLKMRRTICSSCVQFFSNVLKKCLARSKLCDYEGC